MKKIRQMLHSWQTKDIFMQDAWKSRRHEIKKWNLKGESKSIQESMKKETLTTEQLGKHLRELEETKADA